jgi:hypothetical protein
MMGGSTGVGLRGVGLHFSIRREEGVELLPQFYVIQCPQIASRSATS